MKALVAALSLMVAFSSTSVFAQDTAKMTVKQAKKACVKEHKKGSADFKSCVKEKTGK